VTLYGSGAAVFVPGKDGGEIGGKGAALAMSAKGGDDPPGR